MKTLNYILLLPLLMFTFLAEAQIRFFEGSLAEAQRKAQEEKKALFVDFAADWCAPCKMIAEQVFTLPEVGDYFNAHFVNVRVDVEAAKDVAKQYRVEALPTMAFLEADGREIRRVMGMVEAAALLHEARIATGEKLSFEQLYEKYRKKKNVDVLQQLLLDAPFFMSACQGYDRQKWAARIEVLFPEYLKVRKLENMITEPDFNILMLYHSAAAKEDPIFDFVAAHFDQYTKVVGRAAAANYLIGLNNSYIIQLCKKGNPAYKDRLARVNGDLKEVYAGFSFGSLSVLEAITLLSDATYALYRHDAEHFFESMNKYYAGKGAQVQLNDYTQALEDLAMAYQGKLPEEAYAPSLAWIAKALEMKMDAELRTRLLIMMGQCYQHTDAADKARQCYNQAFVTSAEIEDKGVMKQLQGAIQQGLQGE